MHILVSSGRESLQTRAAYSVAMATSWMGSAKLAPKKMSNSVKKDGSSVLYNCRHMLVI